MAKISVIIPCYNYERYLEQCISSVLLQRTEHEVEIIIGDDCSDDSSFEIAKRFESMYTYEGLTISVYRNEQHLGEVMNTEKLLQMVKGEYVAYLDGADYWIHPDKLQMQVEFLDENADHSMCVTGYIELRDTGFAPSTGASYLIPSLPMNSQRLSEGNPVSSSSSRMFRNYGGLYKEYFDNFPFSDWPINFELSFKGKIGFLNTPTYVYRIHSDSLTNNLHEQPEMFKRRQAVLSALLKYRLVK
jgi:glycosyltransferase involved in cell wall biosynthesis